MVPKIFLSILLQTLSKWVILCCLATILVGYPANEAAVIQRLDKFIAMLTSPKCDVSTATQHLDILQKLAENNPSVSSNELDSFGIFVRCYFTNCCSLGCLVSLWFVTVLQDIHWRDGQGSCQLQIQLHDRRVCCLHPHEASGREASLAQQSKHNRHRCTRRESCIYSSNFYIDHMGKIINNWWSISWAPLCKFHVITLTWVTIV